MSKKEKIKCPAVEIAKKHKSQKEKEKTLTEENLKKYKDLVKGLH